MDYVAWPEHSAYTPKRFETEAEAVAYIEEAGGGWVYIYYMTVD